MLFNSHAFLLAFLPAALIIYWLADAYPRLRLPLLIILSFAFYGYWDPRFVPLLAVSILANWLVAGWFARVRHDALIPLAIAANLAVLGFFKYYNFFAANLAGATGSPISYFDLALPLGISFFTFHHIMYLVDLRRGTAPVYPLDRYALYICFFPQVLSGPLVRWSEVVHQFGITVFQPGWEKRCAFGIALITLGLLQKIFLGDALANHVDPLFAKAGAGTITAAEAWVATLGFTFQIFFDFSGYSDIAIGTALLFGIVLPYNFDAPYRATSIREFWRRWHMTLSRFLRDYLFIPLGGSRVGLPRHLTALLITMGLGGLWHGAGWTFVIWGLLHALALAAATIWRRYLPPVPALAGWLGTFLFVSVTWVFFRAPTLDVAWRMLTALTGSSGLGSQTGWRIVAVAAACAIILPASYRIAHRLTERPNLIAACGLAATGIVILVQLGQDKVHEFIYFRF